jgi:hypothetical protein
MNKLGTGLLAACVTLALAATPALAQQGGPGGGMMGKGPGQGQGMMGGPGQGKGMMGGPGQGKGMMQGGMMGKGPGQGGMMGKANCPRMGAGMMGHGMMGTGMMGKGMMHSRPMMEAHLAYIKADLEITDSQMDAWNAYADAVRARHAAMVGMHADMMKAKSGTAVDRLDARIKATETKLESLKAMKPATEGLYNALTDDQKKKADTLLGGGCHMM